MKSDDWVTVGGESGVISSVSPDGATVSVRIPQKDWPFPRYVTVPRKDVKKYRVPKQSYERAIL